MQHALLGAGREVPGDRHGVDMPGEDHPLCQAEAGPRDDRVAVPVHGQMGQGAQRGLDRVGDGALRAADRLDVHQLRC